MFVPGAIAQDPVLAAEKLASNGLRVTLAHVGVEVTDLTVTAYLDLLEQLSRAGLTSHAEVSVKLSTLGLGNARAICQAAHDAGTMVTLDMEDHTTADSTLGSLRELRQDFPETGAALQANLRRTEADCRDLAHAGSRIRLCKGAYKESDSVAFQHKHAVDKSYVRALKILLNGDGYPMIATHDRRLIAIAGWLADHAGRERDSYEYQLLYGVRPKEQLRLAREGHTVRIYLPFGENQK